MQAAVLASLAFCQWYDAVFAATNERKVLRLDDLFWISQCPRFPHRAARKRWDVARNLEQTAADGMLCYAMLCGEL